MKYIYIKIFIIATSLFIAGCGTREQQYVDTLEQLVLRTEKGYTKFDSEAWEKVNAEFERLNENEQKFKYKLSEDEKRKINKLKGRFYLVLTKYKALELQRKGQEIYDQVEGFIEGITKE